MLHLLLAGSLLCVAGAAAAAAAQSGKRELRVCADPDNLPYSNENESGFENRIARLIAEDLHAELHYFWLPLRRGFVRKTMGEGNCDLFIGVPAGFERVLTTRPYYRSTYVFVHRKDEPLASSFDAPALRRQRIGVQLIGNDLAASPPGYALARHGLVANVTGYTVYGDGPAAQRMIEALAAKQIDLALVWGPQAGYFARRARLPMETHIARQPEDVQAPFDYAIAMGVRKDDRALRDELNAILIKRKADIDAILIAYGVPLLPMQAEDER
jgi:quinoprotein dehydrogenase-associated probable ABC transporter substrate-binding protein